MTAKKIKLFLIVPTSVAAMAECHKIAPLVLLARIFCDGNDVVDLAAGSYASTVLAVLAERKECPISAAQAVPLPAILVCPLSLGLHTLFTGPTAVCVALWT
jgi:hypothetical protein